MNNGGAAFARPYSERAFDDGVEPMPLWDQDGMSLRQWLTGLAMAGLLANPQMYSLSVEKIAEWAYANADAVLAYEAKVNDT